MVIGLTGPKLAGKGTAASALQARGGVHYNMSTILSDIVARLHKENSRKNLVALVTGLRSAFGEAVLAEVLKADVEEAGDALAIIDGIRMPEEIHIFSQLPGFQLVYIDAPVEQRYERALQRGEKAGEAEMTFDEFVEEESAVTESHMSVLREKADVIIENVGSIEELNAQIAELL